MAKNKDKVTPERLILDDLIEVKGLWYKNNERKAEFLQRKVEAYNIWANKVVLYILMQERSNNGKQGERRK